MEEKTILEYYVENKDKGKKWVAKSLNLNVSYLATLVDRYYPNTVPLDKELELKLLGYINLFPYTGTKTRAAKYLNTTPHSIRQVLHKTSNPKLTNYFTTPKSPTDKLTDEDIEDILEGSKKGIGNDLMGLMKGVDGTTIRNIRKKFLSSEEYSKYHSIERFYSGDFKSYRNERGDKLLSTWEEKVADFLFNNKIEYSSNIRFHFKDKSISPDFFLPKNRVFIEVFGMSNVSTYIPRMEQKIKYYNYNNIKCLFLFEEDFLKDKKFINLYEEKVLNFVLSLKDITFNQHITNLYK